MGTAGRASGGREGLIAGLNILDLSQGIMGPFCAKLLGDLGANVVKVEHPAGDEARHLGPFPGDQPDIEKSATFLYMNTSKRSVVLDLESGEGREALQHLVGRYDIVVCSQTSEALEAQGLGYDVFKSWNPQVILATISGFGSAGPHSHFSSNHLIHCAAGGWAQLCGVPEREPLQVGGMTSDTLTGAYAAAAIMLASLGRQRHGQGEHIDVSAQDAVLAGAQIPTLLYEYKGLAPERYSSVGSGAGACYMLPTDTGYIGLNALTLAQWQMLCKFLDREDIALDEAYAGMSWTAPDQRLEEVREAFRAALQGRNAQELFHEAQTWRVPFGLVPDLAGLFELPPHTERGFYVPLEHPVCGTVSMPSLPFKSTHSQPRMFRSPLLGEHTEEVFAELEDVAQPASAPAPTAPDLPLAGLRIVDLSMFFAGPVAAQICADAGADVIKVESIQRIDGWRGSGTLVEDGLPSWESSPYFNWVNRNKRAITLDLNDARGVEIVKRLIRDADLLIENYTPRVMEKFGLDYDTLKAINPRLVMISLSGFGADVSWRDYVAFGMSTEQMSGVAHLTGYPGGEPIFTGMTGGDLFSGVMGVTDLLAALHRRDETGAGMHLDFSQIEACNMYIGDAMTAYSLTGHDPGRVGNAHPTRALQGVYACADHGWIAISCRDAHEVALLGQALGLAEVEENALADALRGQDKHALTARLQNSGLAACPVMNGPELLADAHLAARDTLLLQDRPGLGPKHYPNQPYRFANAGPTPNQRAPLLGEHIEEVLCGELGMSDDELAELIIADVVGTEPLAAR
ncbi:MAG: CoA transferase [Pseudomonadota bacterium]